MPMASTRTVSYTHLDVYKRQLKDGDGHDSPGAAEVVPGVGVNVVEQRCAFVCTGVEDVYKRQGHVRSLRGSPRRARVPD